MIYLIVWVKLVDDKICDYFANVNNQRTVAVYERILVNQSILEKKRIAMMLE